MEYAATLEDIGSTYKVKVLASNSDIPQVIGVVKNFYEAKELVSNLNVVEWLTPYLFRELVQQREG